MQRIGLRVVRSRGYHPGEGFVVFGDGGTGTIDWDRPLTSRKVIFWADTSIVAGHLAGGHMSEPFLDGIVPDRHLEGTFLLDANLQPAASITWHSDPVVFGRFQIAVVTEDAVGNRRIEDATLREQVVHSEPPPARALAPASFNASSGCLTLSFEGAERLVG